MNQHRTFDVVFTSALPSIKRGSTAFTLIEMAIVLVIIGLLVGGVLVGRDLIAAAAVRATVSQLEQYKTAANTFYGKYGSLPGDIPYSTAGSLGLYQMPGPGIGVGDGNGLIEAPAAAHGYVQFQGEVAVFWQHLNEAGLIDFNPIGQQWSPTCSSGIDVCIPAAKLGNNNRWVVLGISHPFGGTSPFDGSNYFLLANITRINGVAGGTYTSANGVNVNGVTALQAFAIDNKIDDGQPGTGTVTAADFSGGFSNPANGGPLAGLYAISAVPTCVSGSPLTYTSGTTPDCSLRIQARF